MIDLHRLLTSQRIAIDLETTALNPREGIARLLALSDGEQCGVLDLFEHDPRKLWPVLEHATIIGHHLAFDLPFLMEMGFQPRKYWDTELMERLLSAGSNPPSGYHSLKETAHRRLGIPLSKELQTSDWSGELTTDQLRYAANDVRHLHAIADSQKAELLENRMEQVAEIENAALPAVAWMGTVGVPIEWEQWCGLENKAKAKLIEASAALDVLFPPPPTLGLDLEPVAREWTPAQMLAALRSRGANIDNTDDYTLAKIGTQEAEAFREYRAAQKLVQTYGRGWANPNQGRIYPGWRQMGSVAGRMSCDSPNLQNLPRRGGYRSCIRAPEGRVLIKADYSQIEMRLAAKISGDRKLVAAYRQGLDVHEETAKVLLGRDFANDAERKQFRQIAKSANFGLLYGMSAQGLVGYARQSYGVVLELQEAEKIRQAWFKAYSGLRYWHGTTYKSQTSEVRTLSGRRRVHVHEFTRMLNTPVQGTGADGLKQAMGILWSEHWDHQESTLVIACHDELVLECPAEIAEQEAAWLQSCMVRGMEEFCAPVPVEVSMQIGTEWG